MKKITIALGKTAREIELPDEAAARAQTAICHAYGYQEKISNPEPQPAEGEEGHDTWTETIDNDQPKDDFVKDQIKRFLEEHVTAYEKQKAREDAANAVEDFVI